jgi:hypothetical protein
MTYFTFGAENGTKDKRLAEKLAEFYSRKLGYQVYIVAMRGYEKEGWLY